MSIIRYTQKNLSTTYDCKSDGTALLFSFFMNYKSLDIRKIRCVIRSCPEGLAVADLIAWSGAEPLRVYPILFELEHSGWLEVTERSEWGAPRWVRRKKIIG